MSDEQCPGTDCNLATLALREMARISEQIEDLKDEINKGYPGEDKEGHRRYHEQVIEREAQKVRLRNAIIEKTLTGLVWMMLCSVGIAIWQYFVNSITNGRH